MIFGLIALGMIVVAAVGLLALVTMPMAWPAGRIQKRCEAPCQFCGEPLGWNRWHHAEHKGKPAHVGCLWGHLGEGRMRARV